MEWCDEAALSQYVVSSFNYQARDPSVHAAILAHLNQKYGSGSGQDNSQQVNKQVSRGGVCQSVKEY